MPGCRCRRRCSSSTSRCRPTAGSPGGENLRTRSPPALWPLSHHLAAVVAVAVATAISAPLASHYALSAAPVADALGTWASVFATWLLARRIIETWAWWIVIDAGLAVLFAQQGLWMTAALYLAYAFLAAVGWRSWRARRPA